MSAPERCTRRTFLRGTLLLICAAPTFGAVGCGNAPAPNEYGTWSIPNGTVLDARRYALLAALADALMPGDDTSPGADLARAAWYIDQLLGAFRTDPPRIFAGGPYSGRHGGNAGFEQFQRLTRVEEIRWRTYIEGSQGIPEREWNGPVKGLIDIYRDGLDAIDRVAQDSFGASYFSLDRASRQSVLAEADEEFIAVAFGHVVEGTWGDPVYGGNFQGLGWQAIDYEGDRQPIGFTARQM